MAKTRFKGGFDGPAMFSISVVLIALVISLYFYFQPIDAEGKVIAFWCSIVFGLTLISVILVQCCDKHIDTD